MKKKTVIKVPEKDLKALYYLQANGFWVKNANNQSPGKTLAQLVAMRKEKFVR